MSIATLKKKTQVQYNNMSVGSKQGFSLNGTHRSQGYVGQTSLSRSLPQTTMRGYGGWYGKYPITPIVQSAVTSLNDPNVIKPSVVGTNGMINTHYRWIRRPQPFIAVKPDNNKNLNNQSDYINHIKKTTLTDAKGCHVVKQIKDTAYNTCFIYNSEHCANINGYLFKKRGICEFTKPKSDYVAMSSSEHIEKLNKECTKDDTKYVVTPMQHTPFAC